MLSLCICLATVVALAASASAETPKYFFKLKEINSGQQFTMDELDSERPLVVFVWAADCPHCQRHMPYVVALYKKIDLEKVNFVSISMDESKKEAQDYVAEKELEFPVLNAWEGTFGAGFSDEGWPTTFVFHKGGELAGIVETSGPSYITEVLDLVDKAQ